MRLERFDEPKRGFAISGRFDLKAFPPQCIGDSYHDRAFIVYDKHSFIHAVNPFHLAIVVVIRLFYILRSAKANQLGFESKHQL
ncbi:hypothetical protein ACDZ28_32950 [Paenibacillus sp. RS8]